MKTPELLLGAAVIAALSVGCQPKEDYSWLKNAIDTATTQLESTALELNGTGQIPRCIITDYDDAFLESQLEYPVVGDSIKARPAAELIGTRHCCNNIFDWTVGFFPGSLWYAYELTGKEEFKDQASYFTNLLYNLKDYKKTHDLGFMMNCSYGNAYRLTQNDTIPEILISTANNLIGRYDPQIGCIRSWDFGTWNFPVIIDNMMNLDLLYNVNAITNDPKYLEVAINHATTTMHNHFRPDMTCYHVVSYNPDGTVELRQTWQGKHDESSWSRGQGWAIYGFSEAYEFTGVQEFLDWGEKVADMIMTKVTTDDAIPYWDYEAPATDETPRDASAAAVTACGMLELHKLTGNQKYMDYAEKILKSLSSPAYLAEPGTNQGFVLMHSVGSLPNRSEIDTPINYADYYYLEAIIRYMNIKGITYADL